MPLLLNVERIAKKVMLERKNVLEYISKSELFTTYVEPSPRHLFKFSSKPKRLRKKRRTTQGFVLGSRGLVRNLVLYQTYGI